MAAKKGYVNDYTKSLTDSEVTFLEDQLRAFEAQEGVQVVVAVVESTDGKTIEYAAQSLASEWLVGHRGRDSGILFYLAMKEASSFIDLGYALDQSINDEKAQTICKTKVDPLLKRGKVAQAVNAGVSDIFTAFGKVYGRSGLVSADSFFGMTSLIYFLLSIPVLFFIAKFAESKYMWVSPSLGFLVGLTQGIGLAVALACMGAMMVMICYIIKTYVKPRGQ